MFLYMFACANVKEAHYESLMGTESTTMITLDDVMILYTIIVFVCVSVPRCDGSEDNVSTYGHAILSPSPRRSTLYHDHKYTFSAPETPGKETTRGGPWGPGEVRPLLRSSRSRVRRRYWRDRLHSRPVNLACELKNADERPGMCIQMLSKDIVCLRIHILRNVRATTVEERVCRAWRA